MRPEEFPEYNGPVGILASGGADSSLLLYHVMNKYPGKIHIFTAAIGEGKMSSIKTSAQVIHECIRLTGNRNIEHHISYVEHRLKQPFNMPTLAKEYLSKKEIEVIFFGANVEPDPEVTKEWGPGPGGLLPGMRDPGIHRSEFMAEGWCMPWINMDKREVAELYKESGLMDTLFPLTRSCVGDYHPEEPHCGECWWCKEREWGFGRLQ